MAIVFHLFYFRQYRRENVFYDILERKNAFLGYKTRSSIFSLGNIGQENLFYDILERKKAFLGCKNKKFKKSKKPHIMARHDVIYIEAWCARGIPLGFACTRHGFDTSISLASQV